MQKPQSAAIETKSPRSKLETRRFVPTLTDVVQVACEDEQNSTAKLEPVTAKASNSQIDELAAAVANEQLVARVSAIVMQGLDAHIRVAVNRALETHRNAMTQAIRVQLRPVVEALVRDGVKGETAPISAESVEGCIKATD